MNNSIPGLITLKNGCKVVQTSGHGCKFSDGTNAEFTPEQAEEIKSFWGFLNVKREFKAVPVPVPGLKLSTSSQYIAAPDLQKLDDFLNANPDIYVLASFMVISALREMNIRDNYPRVIAGNATKETSRSAPADKVWDLDNMAY